MTEGIAKSAPSITVVTTPTVTVKPAEGIDAGNDIPLDILRYFNVDLTSKFDADSLKSISDWAFNDVETAGDGLMKLKQLEIKLGIPRGNETRENKLYRWIKIQRSIDELKKKQEAFNG